METIHEKLVLLLVNSLLVILIVVVEIKIVINNKKILKEIKNDVQKILTDRDFMEYR